MQFFTRTRSRSAVSPTLQMRYQHTSSGSSTPNPVYIYGGATSGDGMLGESIQDVQNTGYPAAIKQGSIAMGDLIKSRTDRTHSDANFSFGPYGKPDPLGWGTRKAWGDLASWCDGRITNRALVTQDLNTAKGHALIEAYAKMNRSLVMGGEALATLNQTVSMLRRPFQSSLDLLSRMVKSRNKMIGKTSSSLIRANANAWLEYRYGWRPLLLDADKVIKNASALSAQSSARLVARSSIPFDRTMSWTEVLSGGLPQADTVTATCEGSSRGSASAGVIYVVSPRTTSDQLLATFGLRPCDVPATVWELTPFSFVVDWFTNVGSWIQAVTPVPGIAILGSWVTVVEDSRITCNYRTSTTLGPSLPTYPAVTWTGDGGSSSISTSTVNREINPVIPFAPALTGTSLSVLNSVDALALMGTRVLRTLGNLKH